MRVHFGPSQNERDVQSAIKLCKSVFLLHNPDIDGAFKDFIWFEDPTFTNQHIFVARDNETIVGVIRVIPRDFEIAGIVMRSACLSSICIHPDYRGKKLSYPFMNAVHEWLDGNGFNISYLIARRAVDHYYLKFGYWGIPSYEKVILKAGAKGNREFVFQAHQSIDATLAKKIDGFYRQTYSKCLGFTVRSPDFWEFSARRVAASKNHHFMTICKGDLPIGYLMRNSDEILELGCGDIGNLESIAESVVETFKLNTFSVPHTHPLARALKDYDVVYQSRLCHYGAHMFKLIKPDGLEGIRSLLELSPYERSVSMESSPESRLRYILGLKSAFSDQAGVSFNLLFPDQL